MEELWNPERVRDLAAEMVAADKSLPLRNAANKRALWHRYARQLADAPAEFVLNLVRHLCLAHNTWGLPYEILTQHPTALSSLSENAIELLGQGIDGDETADAFARCVAGPAWLQGRLSDERILRWAHSPDRWWRRVALVSTVALNVRAKGGQGDVERTLAVCRELVDDRDDRVVKALTWALRELVPHDPEAVRRFLSTYNHRLAPRVRQELSGRLPTVTANPALMGQ